MAVNTLEAKARELLGHLGPGKLAAVVHLLEVMVHDADPAEAKAIAEADEMEQTQLESSRMSKSSPSSVSPWPTGRR